MSVAQLVELWIVAPAAGGSNPLAHPRLFPDSSLTFPGAFSGFSLKKAGTGTEFPARLGAEARTRWEFGTCPRLFARLRKRLDIDHCFSDLSQILSIADNIGGQGETR